MSKKFTVPYVAQTSNNTCWQASAQMIWYYWQSISGRQGPMNTLASQYSGDSPIDSRQFIALAEKAGLQKLSHRSEDFSSDAIESALVKHGPLWCAGLWNGYGHIIVLTGVDGEKIYLNDPAIKNKTNDTLKWFNERLSKNVHGCIMYKNPGAY